MTKHKTLITLTSEFGHADGPERPVAPVKKIMALLQKSGEVFYEIQRPHGLGSIDLEVCQKLIRPLREVEQEAIESAMILCLGNHQAAAFRLGICRNTLRKKLREYRDGEGFEVKMGRPKVLAAGA